MREERGRWSLGSPAAAEGLLLPEHRAVIQLIRASPVGQVARRDIAAAMVAPATRPTL